MVLRAPELLRTPRFWAEEGSVYFAEAFSHPSAAALLTPHFGYWSLGANGAALLATLAPLTMAPLVTTLLALLVQSLPIALVAWGAGTWRRSLAQRAAAVAVLVAIPLSGELWLNTINSQFYLAVATFLVLTAAPGTPRPRVVAPILALAGLTGVVSCFLTPLFVYRAARERRVDVGFNALVMVACSAVQLVMFWSVLGDPGVARRFSPLDLPTLGAILTTNSLVWCFGGLHAAQSVATAVLSQRGLPEFAVVGWLLLGAVMLFLVWGAAGVPRPQRVLIIGSFVLISVLSMVAASGSRSDKWVMIVPGFGGRYFYAPNVILTLLVLANLRRDNSRLRQALAVLFLSAAIFHGLRQFRDVPVSGPLWRDEVPMWEADSQHQLRIWPLGWTARLTR